jgi:hypothetical protein
VKNINYVDAMKILRLNINNHPQCPCLLRWKGVIFKKQCFVLYKIQCFNMNSYVILHWWKYEKLFLVNHVFGIDMKVICTTSSGMFLLMVKSTPFQKIQIISSKQDWKIITHSQKFVLVTIMNAREPCAFGRCVLLTRNGWDVWK